MITDSLMVLAVALPWALGLLIRAMRMTPDKQRRTFNWMGLSLWVLFIVSSAAFVYRQELWFFWYGEGAEGTVVQLQRGRGKGTMTNTVKYEFTDGSGQMHTNAQKSAIPSESGTTVHVRYLGSDPDQNLLIADWKHRSFPTDLLFPLVVTAWFGWAYLFTALGIRVWNEYSDRYPDIGAGDDRQTWRFQPCRVGTDFSGNVFFISAGANGLRFAMFILFRPGVPPFVIPWSELRARSVDQGIALNALRVPDQEIFIFRSLADAVAKHVGDRWPVVIEEKTDSRDGL